MEVVAFVKKEKGKGNNGECIFTGMYTCSVLVAQGGTLASTQKITGIQAFYNG